MFGERLKRARIKAGLSLDALANRANNIVTKQAISQYEKNQKSPSSTVLIALASALDLKMEYFFRKVSVEIGEVDFRKHSSFGKKRQEMLKERVKEELERYLELEQILGLEEGFVNPLEDFKIHSFDDVEDAVETLRKAWNLGHNAIANVMQMLELRDIKVIYVEEESTRFNGLSGLASGSDKHPFVVLNRNEVLSLDRKRFTAAHELGHLLLEKNIVADIDHEKVANRFAGAFLLPREILYKEIGKSRTHITMREIIELKYKYKISIQVIMYRLRDLGIITDARYKSFIFANNRYKFDENNPLKEQENELLNRFDNLMARAYSEALISSSKLVELSNLNINEALDRVGVTI